METIDGGCVNERVQSKTGNFLIRGESMGVAHTKFERCLSLLNLLRALEPPFLLVVSFLVFVDQRYGFEKRRERETIDISFMGCPSLQRIIAHLVCTQPHRKYFLGKDHGRRCCFVSERLCVFSWLSVQRKSINASSPSHHFPLSISSLCSQPLPLLVTHTAISFSFWPGSFTGLFLGRPLCLSLPSHFHHQPIATATTIITTAIPYTIVTHNPNVWILQGP